LRKIESNGESADLDPSKVLHVRPKENFFCLQEKNNTLKWLAHLNAAPIRSE